MALNLWRDNLIKKDISNWVGEHSRSSERGC